MSLVSNKRKCNTSVTAAVSSHQLIGFWFALSPNKGGGHGGRVG